MKGLQKWEENERKILPSSRRKVSFVFRTRCRSSCTQNTTCHLQFPQVKFMRLLKKRYGYKKESDIAEIVAEYELRKLLD